MNQWIPHKGPQEQALRRYEFEVLFGGSRGPGKTDAGIVWLTGEQYGTDENGKALFLVDHPRYRALVIRKNANDLVDWLERAERFFRSFGAKRSSFMNSIAFIFPSGAVIRTGHLKDADTYTKYQGHEYHRMLLEEATQIPDEKRYVQLISSCRTSIPEIKARVFLTANPGGKGHGWIKRRFVDTANLRSYTYVNAKGETKEGMIGTTYRDPVSGRKRIYIPARVDDNPTLIENDPDYVKGLDALRSTDEQLWKAWRNGDWDVFIGQVFGEWNQVIHTTEKPPFAITRQVKYIVGYDWGYNSPGCAIWIAMSGHGLDRKYYIYRELYQNKKSPEEWAEDMSTIFKIDEAGGRELSYVSLPHDCFDSNRGGQQIATIFKQVWEKNGLNIRIVAAKTKNAGSRLNRVALTHQSLSISDDGQSYARIHRRCTNLIRTIPELVYDDHNVEDVDTESDDHAWDAYSMALLTEQDLAGSMVVTNNPKELKKPSYTALSSTTYRPSVDVLEQAKQLLRQGEL